MSKHTPMSREEELNARIREIPLSDRLDRSNSMIAKMCSQHRGPKMTIPVQWDDEDYFICLSVKDAKKKIDALVAENARLREAVEFAMSVLKANGVWELSEKMALEKLVAALAEPAKGKGPTDG